MRSRTPAAPTAQLALDLTARPRATADASGAAARAAAEQRQREHEEHQARYHRERAARLADEAEVEEWRRAHRSVSLNRGPSYFEGRRGRLGR
jgi:hypothetical protein